MRYAVKGSWLLDGTSRPALRDAAVVIRDGTVEGIATGSQLLDLERGIQTLSFDGCTVLPGLVNCHSHLTLPGDGTAVEEGMDRSDDHLLLQAHTNGLRSLGSGVTTLADLGSRNDTTFALRGAIESGIVDGPRLVLAGGALTTPKGHCWQFGGEAEGVEGLRAAAQAMLDRGADLLKVMATGGGTRGTDPYNPQFSLEEMRAVVEVAHGAGKPAFAHCTCTEAIRRAVSVGFDVIVHGEFSDPSGVRTFDPEVVELAEAAGCLWNPTLEVAACRIRGHQADASIDAAAVADGYRVYEQRKRDVRRIHEMGVPLAAGSDEGWAENRFGNFALELEALVETGLSAHEAIQCATVISARALGVDSKVGTLEPGKYADILVVAGEAGVDIRALSRVRAVFKGGCRI